MNKIFLLLFKNKNIKQWKPNEALDKNSQRDNFFSIQEYLKIITR